MTIRVGVIGCGSISEFRHAPEYAQNPDVEIVAFYDYFKERAEKFAKKYGGKAVDSYNEILEDESIDAVSDCSTNEMHHVITTAALKHGKHVLCEKPMALSIEDAEEMVAASRESGKILMIDHNQRLADAHKKAKEILKSGELGKVLTFSTTFGHKGPEYWSADKSKSPWFFNKASSGLGVAGDLGIHKVDLIRYLLDDDIEEVSAFMGALDKKDQDGNPISVNDNVLGILKTSKGVLGNATVSWTYYGKENNSTILYCEKGTMKIYEHPDYEIVINKIDSEEVLYKIGQIQTNDNQTSTGVIDEFVNSIINDTQPLITGEDGLASLKIVFALMESAEKKQSIKITK